MFRRKFPRIVQRLVKLDVPFELVRANQLMRKGNYRQAASEFQELAKTAETDLPQRAPFLYIEAGRAAILDGNVKNGIAHLRRGLTMFGSQHRFERMYRIGNRIIAELRERGLNQEAEQIQKLLQANQAEDRGFEPVKVERPILPAHCPSCGGSVKPNEVEWLDEVTAECSYCGSPLREDS